jgi:hypothetical protein
MLQSADIAKTYHLWPWFRQVTERHQQATCSSISPMLAAQQINLKSQ